jgi:hypothetical protein
MGEMRAALDATGARLDEYVPRHAYVATATPEQASEMINLPFVRDVERYGPSKTGPIVLAAGAGDRGEAGPGRVWDLWLSDASVLESVLSWLDQHDVAVAGSGGRRFGSPFRATRVCSVRSAPCQKVSSGGSPDQIGDDRAEVGGDSGMWSVDAGDLLLQDDATRLAVSEGVEEDANSDEPPPAGRPWRPV